MSKTGKEKKSEKHKFVYLSLDIIFEIDGNPINKKTSGKFQNLLQDNAKLNKKKQRK